MTAKPYAVTVLVNGKPEVVELEALDPMEALYQAMIIVAGSRNVAGEPYAKMVVSKVEPAAHVPRAHVDPLTEAFLERVSALLPTFGKKPASTP